jgi:hypothetical protein
MKVGLFRPCYANQFYPDAGVTRVEDQVQANFDFVFFEDNINSVCFTARTGF